MRLADLFSMFRRSTARAALDPTAAKALARAIEIIDPRLGLVPGHARLLGPAAVGAWAYAEAFVARLAPAVDMRPKDWVRNPALRMLFATPQDLAHLLRHNARLNSVFKAEPQAEFAYFLLGAGHRVKQVFGPDLQGGQLRQEVAQDVLSFHDHRVLAPASSEQAVRQRLQQQVFDALLNQVLLRLSLIATRRAGLERQRALLATRLQILRQQEDSLEGAPDIERDARAVAQDLARSDQELADLKRSTGTLKYSLRQARQVLRAPERYLSLTPWSVRTDDMNRLLGDHATPPFREAHFMEARLGLESPRTGVILLGRWPRADWSPPSLRLEDAERYL